MGDYKGQNDQAPRNPELDQSGKGAGKQQDIGNARGNQQSGSQQGAGQQHDIDKQSMGQQSGRKQDGMQDTRQQGIGTRQGADSQRQNQQHGGQHASGGTPALDDLNLDRDSRDQGSPGSGSRQMDQQNERDGKQDQKR